MSLNAVHEHSRSSKICNSHSPSGIFFELVEHRPLAELEYEMELLFPPEHLDQVDQVGVLQVLQHLYLAHRDLLDHRIILRFLAAFRGIILSGE